MWQISKYQYETITYTETGWYTMRDVGRSVMMVVSSFSDGGRKLVAKTDDDDLFSFEF